MNQNKAGNKAVVLGANYYIGLSIMRRLGVEGVHVVGVDYAYDNSYAFRSKYCKEKLIAPFYKENPRAYVDFLIDYAKKQSLKPVLFPSGDPYVELIDEYMDELREYYLFPNIEKGTFTRLLNKDTLQALCMEIGVLVPETVRTDEPNYEQKVIDTVGFPCLVKPVDSPTFVNHFRKKLFVVDSLEEMREKIKLSNDANLEVIVQRIIPGFDDHMHTFDAYMDDNSDIVLWTTCQKYRQYPINYGASVYTGQKYVPELYEIGKKFYKAAGFKGFAEIEFKKDATTGKFYLIEVNVRTTNLDSLLYSVGLNMPYAAYAEVTGQPVAPKAVDYDTNKVFWYAYEDLFAVRNYIKTGQLTRSAVFKSYFKPKAHAIWSLDDPKPYFAFAKNIFKKLLKKFA